MKYLTNSDKETIHTGYELGRLLSPGDVIALTGVLGSGKTCFTKGLALGLGFGHETVITSPSFAIVNEYPGEKRLCHMDLYRLDNEDDFITSGLDEYIEPDNVVVMEWADRWPEILPEWRIDIRLEILDSNKRELSFFGHHDHAWRILEDLSSRIM